MSAIDENSDAAISKPRMPPPDLSGEAVNPATTNPYVDLAAELGALVAAKNVAYGDSHGKTGAFLELLYPTGISPAQFTDALTVVRIFDKLQRIATNKDALGESPYADIAGYALLGLKRDRDLKAAVPSSH